MVSKLKVVLVALAGVGSVSAALATPSPVFEGGQAATPSFAPSQVSAGAPTAAMGAMGYAGSASQGSRANFGIWEGGEASRTMLGAAGAQVQAPRAVSMPVSTQAVPRMPSSQQTFDGGMAGNTPPEHEYNIVDGRIVHTR